MANGVRNVNLNDSLLSASSYNVHKHFDLEEGGVMIYETVRGPNHPDFILCSPRAPGRCEDPMASTSGPIWTGVNRECSSAHADFVAEFVAAVLRLGVQDVFSLTAKKPETKRYTKFEMSDLSSTILVNNPTWLPGPHWISSEGVDPWYHHSDCAKTQTGEHYHFTCSRTLGGIQIQYQQKSAVWDDGKSGQQEQLTLDGEVIPVDSEPFATISYARQMVEAF